MLTLLAIVFLAGAIGGVINALLTDNGFILPVGEPHGNTQIWRPGIIGNVLIGAIAAVISWGLYGPFASTNIFTVGSQAKTDDITLGLTLASFVGAILVGIAGAKWLTNEVDKKLLRATAGAMATARFSPDQTVQIMSSAPARALQIARELSSSSGADKGN